MKLPRLLLGVAIVGTAPATLAGQADPDPGQPRPPLLLEASRSERLEAAVRMYLAELIGAIQRGDTVTLKSLVPDEVVPDTEKSAAGRAGCSSLGAATVRLRIGRAKEAPNAALPLSGVILGPVSIALRAVGDTVALVQSRVMERRAGRLRYAPVEILVLETNGSWRVGVASGLLAGTCGLGLDP